MPMEVDDLGDLFGTESRVRNSSLRTQRRALRQEQRQQEVQFATAREMLRAVAAAQTEQQTQHHAAYALAQGRLQEVEQKLMGEAELQRQQRDALKNQADAQAREVAVLQARLHAERQQLAKQHEAQARVVREREQSLLQHKQQVLNEREAQRLREVALSEEAQRLGHAHAEAGKAWQEAQAAAAEVERRVREAEERGYARAMSEMEAKAVTARQVTARTHTPQARMQVTMPASTKTVKIPPSKDAKLNMRTFNGKELHRGLGAGFKHWARGFKDEIEMAQEGCGYMWPEKYKISKLGSCLRGEADEFFNGLRDEWWDTEKTLEYALEEMEAAFSRLFTSAQVSELFRVKKAHGDSWHSHYLYLMAVRNATGASSSLIPESLVLHASTELRPVLASQYDKKRTDYVVHALEITQWAQTYEDNEKRAFRPAKAAVAATVTTQQNELRNCHNCDEVGHIAKYCPMKVKHDKGSESPRWALSGLIAGSLTSKDWIVDSGASAHLVSDKKMLYDWEDCDDPNGVTLPDKSKLHVTRRGKTKLRVQGEGETYWVELKNASYAPKLAVNLISLGTLMLQGCMLTNKNQRYAVTKGDEVVMYVQIKQNVLVVDQGETNQRAIGLRDVVMNAIQSSATMRTTMQKGSLMSFHQRFGHLNYNDVERLAADPANGVELTDRVRENCLTCAEGKQAKTAQPKTDSGTNAPTDIVGGVICSDLKGPILPVDRKQNRYLVNFVDHKTNYVRVFVAKTKDEAAKKFEHFMVFFERQFNVRVHILRTDGGGEYRNLDLFCQQTGIGRQTTEPNTSASNGKAERMHRTVMNMVRCMLFGSGLGLSYWSFAAEYAAYVLNRMPTRANPGRKSPLECLTGKPVSVVDVVVFGSPCKVYQTPKNRSTDKRSTPDIIIEKNEETKGYKVLLTQFRTVVTTRHVGQIETLSAEANEQLKQVLAAEIENELERLAQERQQDRRRRQRSHARDDVGNAAASKQKSKVQKAKRNSKSKNTTSGDDHTSQLQHESRHERSEAQITARSENETARPDDGRDGGKQPRRPGRQRTKSKKQKDADHAKEASQTSKSSTNTGQRNADVRRAGAPVVATVLATTLAMSVLGAGEEQYVELPDPKSYRASLEMPDAHLWARAREEEIDSLVANKTWEVVKRERNMHLLRSKWVLRKKKDGNGAIERYKARLVAGGDDQVLGRDYNLTFAAVLDMMSGKILMAVARLWNVRARHFDVPSAYLRAYKEEDIEIFMRIPEGMKLDTDEMKPLGETDANGMCLRLVKSLYGLKQAGRLWNQLLHKTLTEAQFEQSVTDACVYVRATQEGTIVVGVYVDDLLATATRDALLDQFGAEMQSLELKCLGPVENFLGMRIGYDETNGYSIDQEQMIYELLHKNGLDKANAVRAPIADESSLESESVDAVALPVRGAGEPEKPSVKSFQSLVGSLLWMARCSRPDIAYAVHRATRQSPAPTDYDMKLAKRILRYLAGTAGMKLRMGGVTGTENVKLCSYTDADYAADKATRKSVSGAFVLVNGMPVGWQVKQQTSVALSTAEAEFVAAAIGAKELLGVRNLMSEMGVQVEVPMRMLVDNQAAIKQIANEATSSSQKHVEVKMKFIRDSSAKGMVKPEYVATADMLADMLTKSMAAPRLAELREKIGLK